MVQAFDLSTPLGRGRQIYVNWRAKSKTNQPNKTNSKAWVVVQALSPSCLEPETADLCGIEASLAYIQYILDVPVAPGCQ